MNRRWPFKRINKMLFLIYDKTNFFQLLNLDKAGIVQWIFKFSIEKFVPGSNQVTFWFFISSIAFLLENRAPIRLIDKNLNYPTLFAWTMQTKQEIVSNRDANFMPQSWCEYHVAKKEFVFRFWSPLHLSMFFSRGSSLLFCKEQWNITSALCRGDL